MRYLAIVIIMIVALIGNVVPARALEHDHQPWNEVGVGRMIAIGRIDARACRRSENSNACGEEAAKEAKAKLREAIEVLRCRSIDRREQPIISTRDPFTRYDPGPLVLAEMSDVYCRIFPRQQLIPVSPKRFTSLCSQLAWKCDVVWISDGDPSVLYVNRLSDIPPLK